VCVCVCLCAPVPLWPWQSLLASVFGVPTPINKEGFGLCLPPYSTWEDFKSSWTAPSVDAVQNDFSACVRHLKLNAFLKHYLRDLGWCTPRFLCRWRQGGWDWVVECTSSALSLL
jgi:hypothetical protein